MGDYLISYLWLSGLVLLPVAAGMVLRRMGVPRGVARYCFYAVLFGAQTPIAFMAVWIAQVSGDALFMPLMTLAGWLITIGLAALVSRPLKHPPKQRGAFIVAMGMSNHGYTLLGMVAMVLFGEAGLAQAQYAQLLFVPYMVLLCFPIGRMYGGDQSLDRPSMPRLMLKSLADPRSLPLAAMLAGLALNLTGTPRPEVCARVVPVLVYAGTIVSGLAIGLQFRGLALKKFWRENLYSFLYRLTIYPLIYFGLARLFGLSSLNARILLLYGLVPTALFASLVADFFDLDTDLTTSIFVAGTILFLLLVLPVFGAMVVLP